jgi:hypothetical protein
MEKVVVTVPEVTGASDTVCVAFKTIEEERGILFELKLDDTPEAKDEMPLGVEAASAPGSDVFVNLVLCDDSEVGIGPLAVVFIDVVKTEVGPWT